MAAVALIDYGVLLVLVFGVRTILHRRRTGNSGWLRPSTRVAWLGDGLFTLGVGATLAAPVLHMTGVLDPIEVLDSWIAKGAGAVSLAAGSATAALAQVQLGTAWRAGIDGSGQDRLVERGLFGVVRHPFYLGMMAATAGVAGLTPNRLALIGTAALVAGCHVDALWVEEPALQAAYGDTYRKYAAVTPRFVPNPFRRPAG